MDYAKGGGGRARGERKLLAKNWCFESAGNKWVDSECVTLISLSIYCQGALEHPSAAVETTERSACAQLYQGDTEHAGLFASLPCDPYPYCCSQIYLTVTDHSLNTIPRSHMFDIFWSERFPLMVDITDLFNKPCPNEKSTPDLCKTAPAFSFHFLDRPHRYILYLKCVLQAEESRAHLFCILLRCLFTVQHRAMSNVKMR